MWTKQQQRNEDFDGNPYEYEDSWEEQAFAEDAAGPLGFVWPPRSYSCSFCRREFRSAQALGGHMNVHRRDRARLQQSPNSQKNPFKSVGFQCPSQQVFTLVHDVSNPKTYPSFSGFHSVSSSDEFSRKSKSEGKKEQENDKRVRFSDPTVKDRDYSETGFSNEGLNFGFRLRPSSVIADGEESPETSCKRRKTDDGESTQVYVGHHHRFQSEVIGVSSSSLHDLDLELRLGGVSKVD